MSDVVDEVDGRRVVATPGDLVAAREARGMSQIDISQRIKLQIRQVAALEEGSWDLLPGRAFARGALRSYGKLVDADVSPLLDSVGMADVSAQLPLGAISTRTGPRTSVAIDSGRRARPMLWVIGGLIAVVGLVFYFGAVHDEGRQQSPVDSAEVARPAGGPSSGGAVDPRTGATPPGGPVAAPAAGGVPSPSAGSAEGSTAGAAAGTGGEKPMAGATSGASTAGGSDAASAGSTAPVAAGPAGAPGAAGAAGSAATAGSAAPTGSAGAAGSAATAGSAAAPAPLAGAPAGASGPGSSGAPGEATSATGSGSGQGVIRFTTTENSWVGVRDATGKQIHAAVVPAGTTVSVQGKPPYQLTLGNSSRMKVQYDGKERKVPPPNEKNIARLELP